MTFMEAKEIIEKEGKHIYSVKVASPPKNPSNEYDDDYRVIDARELNKLGIELIVCKAPLVLRGVYKLILEVRNQFY